MTPGRDRYKLISIKPEYLSLMYVISVGATGIGCLFLMILSFYSWFKSERFWFTTSRNQMFFY